MRNACRLAVCLLVCAVVVAARAAEFQQPAEMFVSKKGDIFQVLQPPFVSHEVSHHTAPASVLAEGTFTISDAIGGAFIGVPGMALPGGAPVAWIGGENTDFVKYEIDVPKTAAWYLWLRAIAVSQRDNSFYLGIDIDDAAAVSGDTGAMNVLDLYDAVLGPWTTEWVWFPFNSRTGPVQGREASQWTNDRVGVQLTEGTHNLHITPREPAYIDHFWATTVKTHDPNVEPPTTAVQPSGKLATMWSNLKRPGGD